MLSVCARGRSWALPVVLAVLAAFPSYSAGDRCVACHPKEVEAYSRSPMALALSRPTNQASGSFEHLYSHTTFTMNADENGLVQRFVRNGEAAEQRVAYVIGSGSHAFG